VYDIPKFKIIIFGKDSVGKANFIQRSLSDLFSSESKMAIGVEFYGPKIVSVDGQKVKLQAWDFSGGEQFRSLSPFYIRGARGGLFVWDIAEPSSFVHIDYWLSSVRKKNKAEDIFPILVVGILPDESEERQLTTEEGTKLAESRNLNGYIECNPKTGENVDKVFEDLTRLMLAHKDCRLPQKRDEALPFNKDNLKENKTLETEKQLLYSVGLRLEQDVNSLRNEKGVERSVRLEFIRAKRSQDIRGQVGMHYGVVPLDEGEEDPDFLKLIGRRTGGGITPHPYIFTSPKPPDDFAMAPQGKGSYRDQIINLLSKIKRLWDLTNSRIIAVALVQGKDTILYSTDNWDISADVGRVISSWSSLNVPFIVISGVKYSVLQSASERLVATSIRGEGHILGAKDDDYTLILHVEPDSGPMGNLDRGPPRDPGSAREAALVDF